MIQRRTLEHSADSTLEFVKGISECVALLGTAGFDDCFLAVARLTGALQVTAFAYEEAEVRCILSRNFRSERTGRALAAAYVDGAYREDPLSKRALEMPGDGCMVERLEDHRDSLNRRYLEVFFESAGLRTKASAIVAQGELRMVLNYYFDRDLGASGSAETLYFGLAARVLAAHQVHLNPVAYSPAFALLSERERQVCAGMLEGKKAEIIAQEMGIAPSSIITYRQRAYQKLGISSRGQLFSIGRVAVPNGRPAMASGADRIAASGTAFPTRSRPPPRVAD